MKKLAGSLLLAVFAMTASTAMAAATFYEGPGFGGQPLTVNGGVADFRAYDYNDRAMSMVVEGEPVVVCEHVNFGGNCQLFNPGQYPHLGVWSHTISSVRPAYARYGRHQHRYDNGYGQWEQDRRYGARYGYGGY